MEPDIKELINEILDRGWVFELTVGDVLTERGTPMRLIALTYHAEVRTPNGRAAWADRTPGRALDGALDGAKRMHEATDADAT